MKLLLLTLSLVAIVSAQTCGDNKDLGSCIASADCGFCDIPNEGLCMGCHSLPECSENYIKVGSASGCSCATSQIQCARTSVQSSVGGDPEHCEWCPSTETCHGPGSDELYCCVDEQQCNAKSDRCNFCSIKESCFALPEYNDLCTTSNNEYCDANCAEKPEDILCGTNGEEFRNQCELEHRRYCLHAGVDLAYQGRCCGNLDDETMCGEHQDCMWCNQQCKRKSELGCPDQCALLDSTSCGSDCEWCDKLSLCLNPEITTCPISAEPIPCEDIPVNGQRDFCTISDCQYCERTGKCVTNITASCKCSELTQEGACIDTVSCKWCANAGTCKSERDFSFQECLPDNYGTCAAISDSDFSDSTIKQLCESKETSEGGCSYCERLPLCYPNLLDATDVPVRCDCATNDQQECEDTAFCTWCNDKCLITRLKKPEDCGLPECASRTAEGCNGDCAWCRNTKECIDARYLPKHCECNTIIDRQTCNTIGGIDAQCNWCESSDNVEDFCVRGTSCNDGTLVCNEKLGPEACKICEGEGTWQFCPGDSPNGGFCTNQESCNATEDICPNFIIEPIVECVSALDATRRIACLGYEAEDEFQFKVDSIHNIISGIMDFPHKILLRIFNSGRSRRFPGCAQRVEFTTGDRAKYCICDRCVDIDENRLCPKAKWVLKFALTTAISDQDLLAKIRLYLSHNFPHIDIDRFILRIIPSKKRQSQILVEIETDADPNTVATMDETLNGDITELINDVGIGTTITTENSGSGVAQNSVTQNAGSGAGSGASTLFVGVSIVLSLAGLFFTL